MRRARLLLCALLTLLACGQPRPRASGSRDASRASGTDSGARDALASVDSGDERADAGLLGRDASGEAEAGPPDAGEADAGWGIATCMRACSEPRDCVTASSAVVDVDNWSCVQSACQYLGCRSDRECSETYGDAWLCRVTFTGGLPGCVKRCAAPSDCAVDAPLLGERNYRCVRGACVWQGCSSDEECAAANRDARYRCEASLPVELRVCVLECSRLADCVLPGSSAAFDADNYACEARRCRYLGCRNADECRAVMADDSYVCR
jgi:hypothetical protein